MTTRIAAYAEPNSLSVAWNAVGSSLVAVAAFGVTTAANYALSGWVEWRLAATFIGGGLVGGARVARHLGGTGGQLRTLFAGLIFAVAAYLLWRSMTR